MEWHHKNRIKGSMAYIERMLASFEERLDGKAAIYESVSNDLNSRQARAGIRKIYRLLAEAKKELSLDKSALSLSHILEVDCVFIMSTIEELWSSVLEKGSGKIASSEMKEKLDRILREIKKETGGLMDIARAKKGDNP